MVSCYSSYMSNKNEPQDIELLDLTPEQVMDFKDRMGLLPRIKLETPEEASERNHKQEALTRSKAGK